MVKKRKTMIFLALLVMASVFSGKEVYAKYESSEDDGKPFMERDFSFMSEGDEGVEKDIVLEFYILFVNYIHSEVSSRET